MSNNIEVETENSKRCSKMSLGQFLESVSSKNKQTFNKENMSNRLKNSAPCRHTLKNGKCVMSHCTFAHSLEELTPPVCFFDKNCKKIGHCNSIHSGETREFWLEKMGYNDVFKNTETSPAKITQEDVFKNTETSPAKITQEDSKVIIIFPEKFSEQKIKNVFEELLKLDISNIEIRRTN